MKNKIIIAAISVILNLITVMGVAQDYHFTQYNANPLRLNPAMMGANSDMRFILGYRNQWSNIQKGFTTYSFTGLYCPDGKLLS